MLRPKNALAVTLAVALAAGPGSLAFADGSTDAVSRVNAVSAQSDSGSVELQAGTYRVPVTLTSAASVEESTMPSVFLKPDATLYVTGDTAKIVVTLQTASIMGGSYNASGLSFYPDDAFSVASGVLSVSSGAVATSQVLTYLADSADEYNHYPAEVMGTLPRQTMTNGGYAAVSMGSAQMSSSLLCLKIDWSGLQQTASDEPQIPTADPADKSLLNAQISKARGVAKAEGHEDAYRALQEEADLADAVASDAGATQTQVDTTAKRLRNQIDSYRKLDLQALYDEASKLELGRYTSATRSELSKQLSVAQAVLDDLNASDEAVSQSYVSLKAAYDGMQEAGTDKSALGAKIDEAAAVSQGKKSDQAFGALQTAIETARGVYDDDAATQSKVNDALVALNRALNAFNESADQAEPADDDPAVFENGMLYRATARWMRADEPSAQSMMANYLERQVEVRASDEGYDVRVMPTGEGDALIDGMYLIEGGAGAEVKVPAEVVSSEGVTPRQYRIVASALESPLTIGADVRMGSDVPTLVKALLYVDGSEATKADPVLSQGVDYEVPLALYREETYGTAGQEPSELTHYYPKTAGVTAEDGDFKVTITMPRADGVAFGRLVYGNDRIRVAPERNDDGTTSYTLSLETLSDAVILGLTQTAGGNTTTTYADAVFQTAYLNEVAKPEPGGDPQPGDDSGVDPKPGTDPAQGDNPGGGSQGTDPAPGDKPGEEPGADPIPVQTVEMHRLYNSYTGEHFYTSSIEERDATLAAGWKYEGVGWTAPKESRTPVFRLYNKYAGDHHYTVDVAERDHLIDVGWNYEGIGWYSDDAKTTPLYRQYNPYAQAGSHNYTVHKDENDLLVSLGWRYEGIAWYGA